MDQATLHRLARYTISCPEPDTLRCVAYPVKYSWQGDFNASSDSPAKTITIGCLAQMFAHEVERLTTERQDLLTVVRDQLNILHQIHQIVCALNIDAKEESLTLLLDHFRVLLRTFAKLAIAQGEAVS